MQGPVSAAALITGRYSVAAQAAGTYQGMQAEVHDHLARPNMGCKRARKLIIPEQRVFGALPSRHLLPAGFQVNWTPWHLLYEAGRACEGFAWCALVFVNLVTIREVALAMARVVGTALTSAGFFSCNSSLPLASRLYWARG